MKKHWARWILSAIGAFMFAGCGAPGSPIAGLTQSKSTALIKQVSIITSQPSKKASSLIRVRYGRTYQVSVPASVRHQTIGIADTPKGVVLLLPPHWVSADPTNWIVALASPKESSSNLLSRGAHVLARLNPIVRGQSMNLVAITDGYALITESMSANGEGSVVLWSVDLTTGAVRRLHQWDLDQVSGLPFVSGRGVVAWWDSGTGHGTALDLATGESVTIPDIGSAEALGWENGTLWANGSPIHLSFLTPYVHALPRGYQWLGDPPIVAIPQSWNRAAASANDETMAQNGSNTQEDVVVTTSHCEGCYLAGHVSNRVNAVSGPDSPELQVPKGTLLFWLSDHAIAYTLPTTLRGYRTYGVTVTAPQGGMVRAQVTVPVADMKVATTILNSLWWP
ncbi:MAG: hypothetical protein M1415_07355 [Firmicutes bacterium]|jgi:hypothetical protein|nr:hypothetical protein [Bacillota bacterium]MCL5066056.1 hypothetical protein [Bacillota bacterium]